MSDKKVGNSSNDWNEEIFWIVLSLMLFVLAWIIWHNFRQVVVYPAFALNWAYLKMLATAKMLDAQGYEVLDFIERVFKGEVLAANDVNWNLLLEIRNFVGQQTRFVNAGVILICILVWRTNIDTRTFTRQFTYNLGKDKRHKLHEYLANLFPIGTVSAFFDADGYDRDITQAQSPIDWMLEHQIEFEEGELDVLLVNSTLKKQLGKRWTGLENTHYLMQTVVILCALDVIGHEKSYEEREAIAFAWCGRKNGAKKSKALVKRYIQNSEVRAVIDYVADHHAYELTVVLGMLKRSSDFGSGVFSSEFLWMRRLDRRLWYTINNFDRLAYFVEGMAPICHFNKEVWDGKKIYRTNFDEAVGAFLKHLRSSEIYSITEYLKQLNPMKKDAGLDRLRRWEKFRSYQKD